MSGERAYAHLVEDTLAEIAGFAARKPLPVIGACVALALVALALSVWQLRINTDTSGMISEDPPFRQSFLERNRAFPALENAVIAVLEADERSTARSAARALVRSLRDRPAMFSHVYSPGVSEFFERNALLYLKSAEFQETAGRIQASAGLLQGLAREPSLPGLAGAIEQAARSGQAGLPEELVQILGDLARVAASRLNGRPEQFDWESSIAGDLVPDEDTALGVETGKAFVFFKPVLNFSVLEPAKEALDEAVRLAEDTGITLGGRVKVRFTGKSAMESEELRTVFNGAALAAFISLVLVTLVLIFGVRSWRLVAAAVSMLLVGLMLTAGFAAIVFGELNLISVAFAVLFVGLGIDFAIHFALRFEEESGHLATVIAALEEVAATTGPALLLCTGTTAIAFLSFAPTDFAGMAQLGFISAWGMLIALILSITFMPALLVSFGAKAEASTSPLLNWALPAPTYEVRKYATLTILGLGIVALYMVPSARFDGDPVELKDPDAPAVQVFRELRSVRESPVYLAELLVPGPEAARIQAQRLKDLFEVRGVISALSFVPADQESRLTRIANLSRIFPASIPNFVPDRGDQVRMRALDELIAALSGLEKSEAASAASRNAGRNLRQTLELARREAQSNPVQLRQLELDIFSRLPEALGKLKLVLSASRISVDSLEPDLRNRFISSDGEYRLEILPEAAIKDDLTMRHFVDAVQSVAQGVTGVPVEIVRGADTVSKSMLQATGLAALLICIILFLTLRRIGDVLLVLCPIVLAGILLIAATVLFKIPFNFANVIVLPLLIGLGVDSGIHLVMRAREELDYGRDTELLKTCTPRAVLLSALTTFASFGSLALSAHRGTASMGELLTISIVLTLVCTLIVLPTLVDWFVRRPGRRRRAP